MIASVNCLFNTSLNKYGGFIIIIGLIGSSCCGKSFFSSLLQDQGFIVPQSITTRKAREEED